MKNKKRFFGTIIMACLMACAFLFSACGEEETIFAWGKSYYYNNVYNDDYETKLGSSQEAFGKTKKELLIQEYTNGNLLLDNIVVYYGNTMVTDVSLSDATSADDLIAKINAYAKDKLMTMYNTFSFSVGTEEEKKITINSVTYYLLQEISEYNYTIGTTTSEASNIGNINVRCDNYNGKEYVSLNLYDNIHTSVSIAIYTKTVVNDPTMSEDTSSEPARTYISLNFYPLFSLANA